MEGLDLLMLAGMGLYGLWGAVRWRWPAPPRQPTAADGDLALRVTADAHRRRARRLQVTAARQLARQRAQHRNGGRHG